MAQSPAAKVKRARASRRGTGASASPVAVSTTVTNEGQATESHAASSLHAIQEEEMYEPLQANSASVPADDCHSNDHEYFDAEHLDVNAFQRDEVQADADESNAVYPRAELLDDGFLDTKLCNGDQSDFNQSNADMDNVGPSIAEHLYADYRRAKTTNTSLTDMTSIEVDEKRKDASCISGFLWAWEGISKASRNFKMSFWRSVSDASRSPAFVILHRRRTKRRRTSSRKQNAKVSQSQGPRA